ncbi:MAG: type VI secretion system tip protein VgrG [Polaromonas sp.]|uniref:type VI secretion system Vgr family protein n=1 Tax=Polaromonas sp. TaxID=1869339 RepID=UPI0017B377BA|nr:type VI secretion system Vgr family protein [Polaromonas sp.]NMM08662.1 type VI secretion system tip protein VgrG [Polaromonas sp.]
MTSSPQTDQTTQNIVSLLQANFSSAKRLYDLSIEGVQEASPLGAMGTGFLPGQTFMVEAYVGLESLHTASAWDILVLSLDAHVSLSSLLGKICQLHTALADGTRTTTTGMINQALLLGSEGGLARYRLHVVDWTWMLGQSTASRVWQDTRVLDILASIFARYAPQAAWGVSDEVGPFMREAHQEGMRSYCVQYRETDLAFVQRLLTEEGLAWRIEEHADSPAKHRLLIFADSTQKSAFPEDYSSAHVLGGQGIRFHRGHAKEAQDSLQALAAQRRLPSAAVTLLSTDYKSKQSLSASAPTTAAFGGKNAPRLEIYRPQAPYAFANRTQAQRQAELQMQALEARHERYFARSTVRTLRAGTRFTLTQAPLPALNDPHFPGFNVLAVSHLGLNNLPKPAVEGLAELLGDVPELLSGLLRELQCPQGIAPASATMLLDTAALVAQAQALGYANQCELLRADIVWRPLPLERPTAPGAQTALVVGPDGSPTDTSAGDLYGDKLGRVRIRLHWQGQMADGDGASSGNASCWVRVAQRSAAAGMGLQFLPRVGQEVLVRFLGGDIERPIIVSALYNGQGEGGVAPTPGGQTASTNQAPAANLFAAANDHRPSAQGNLMAGGAAGNSPPWFGSVHGRHGESEAASSAGGHANAAAQWGIRTQEWGSAGAPSAGYNQLVFDDNDAGGNQQRIQLKTSQYASELNLGHLIHTADNYRGSLRGQGFELRSDAYGAVRAGAGLMFTTYAIQHNARQRDPAGHATVKLASHEGSIQPNASTIDEAAAPLAALLKASATQVSGQRLQSAYSDAPAKQTSPSANAVPHSGGPILTLAGQAGLGLIAGQSLQFSNGETLSLMSGQDSQSITGGQLRIHSGQAIGILGGAAGPGEDGKGLTLIAAQDPVRYEAQSDAINIQAKELINLQSANSNIDFAAAKSISLSTAAGANITIEGGNITVQCPGKLTVHASAKKFDGPTSLSRETQTWPKVKFDEEFILKWPFDSTPAANRKFQLIDAQGVVARSGTTDGEGKTGLYKSQLLEGLSLKIIPENI